MRREELSKGRAEQNQEDSNMRSRENWKEVEKSSLLYGPSPFVKGGL